jgi:hypothetical protein
MADIFPSDISDFVITLNGTEITSTVSNVIIYQTISDPSWTATLFIDDTVNMLNSLPILSGSEITITAQTDSPVANESADYTFIVYKIADRELIKPLHYQYTLHCIPEFMILANNMRVTEALGSDTAPNHIAQLTSRIGLTVEDKDDSAASFKYIVPNWNILHSVQKLLKLCKNGSGGADFNFFQSDNTKCKVKSFDKMFDDAINPTVSLVQKYNTRQRGGKYDSDSFVSITGYKFVQHQNILHNYHTGYYGSTLIEHDLIHGEVERTEFKYGDDIGSDNDKKPFTGDIFTSGVENNNIVHKNVHSGMYDDVDNAHDDLDWVSSRKSNMMKQTDNILLVNISGISTAKNWLGKSIEVILPTHEDETKEDDDKYFKGDYVITAIKHTIGGDLYSMTLELVRKQLEVSL